jgi:putative colanic acid biosynthesis acetyltransferase WcaF
MASPHLNIEKAIVDLSNPDNSEYKKGRPAVLWALWYFIGSPILSSGVIPISALKCLVLRIFGARIGLNVYIKPRVRVKFPWFLAIGDNTWIGEDVWIDNLAQVEIGANVCVSQGAYLCTGNHDWKSHNMKLFRQSIVLEDGCWVGAKSIVCPGTTVSRAAVVTAGSVVSKRVGAYEIWAGNPARRIKHRDIVP